MTRTVGDFGLTCGILPTGADNAITDVPGVRVGHCTLRNGDINTGVTAILPHGGNIFRNKVIAASHVINGFGKTVGLTQVQELGTIETPILLTNTLSVGTCATALIRDAIRLNPDIGRSTGTVNPVVGECNDGPLNDIQALAISEEHALAALADAHEGAVEQGNVGAGTGMSCFGFKGGIGSASRKIAAGGERHLGVLVLSNFGKSGDLVLPDGRRPDPGQSDRAERGSIMVILATDVPLEHRQLERVARRTGAGIARLGSFWGHGSGDIAIAFSTGNMVDHDEARDLVPLLTLNEARIDILLRAAAEATQEAVLNSMLSAQAFTGRAGTRRTSLADWLRDQAEKR
ncbi:MULTISPECIES: P1 family peptidase [unclassified Mesorhizobium]|uniref:DmpA family aminopeptidase n=1 Tax=unclassified Mesorhizobium TaxID=325217 RepID=UPI000FCCA23A|nr:MULTISPECIES: P1 family peptidase [unclassified Mesorhizobium]RUX92942.1 S58 family peptidase [Mesorhizobium sp. M7D.F.Ca.US.004.01.2.1]RVA33463.1 S58 family peptidase [Mesorhizobium sp. M7D.F.Ca.US.004.03.1.1]